MRDLWRVQTWKVGTASGLAAAAAALLALLAAAMPALAQEEAPPEGPLPAPGPDLGPLTGLLQAFLARFDWLPGAISDASRDMLRELLPAVWAEIVPDLPGVTARGVLLVLGYAAQWWLAGLAPQLAGEAVRGSLLVQTPAALTTGNPDVLAMQRDVRNVAALLLAPLLAWGALGVYLGLGSLEATLKGALVGVVGVFGAEHLCRGLLDFGNALALQMLGGTAGMPGYQAMTDTAAAAVAPDAEQAAVNAGAALVVYALASALTLLAAIFHLAGVVVLFVLAPLAGALSVVPALQAVGKATLIAFATAVLVKVPGVICLRLATVVLGGTAPGAGGDPAGAAFAVLAALGIAAAYSAFLAKGALFAGGHLVSGGRQATRAVVTAVREPRQVAEYRRRIEERLAPGAHGGHGGQLPHGGKGGSAGAVERPVMITHSHTHGHLLGRDQGVPAQQAPAQSQPPAGRMPATTKE
jgi:hypothetical protein